MTVEEPAVRLIVGEEYWRYGMNIPLYEPEVFIRGVSCSSKSQNGLDLTEPLEVECRHIEFPPWLAYHLEKIDGGWWLFLRESRLG